MKSSPADLSRVYRWREAMAQYEPGHIARVANIEKRVAAIPGLAMAGNAYHGIGVPDCVRPEWKPPTWSAGRAGNTACKNLGSGIFCRSEICQLCLNRCLSAAGRRILWIVTCHSRQVGGDRCLSFGSLSTASSQSWFSSSLPSIAKCRTNNVVATTWRKSSQSQ